MESQMINKKKKSSKFNCSKLYLAIFDCNEQEHRQLIVINNVIKIKEEKNQQQQV